MSKELERLEKLAAQTVITDHDEIDRIIGNFLGMRYRDLHNGNNSSYNEVPTSLSEGFALDYRKVEEMTVGEILTVFGFEAGARYYERDSEDWIRSNKLDHRFSTAEDCFFLARTLTNVNKVERRVTRFLKIDFYSFMDYLADKTIAIRKAVKSENSSISLQHDACTHLDNVYTRWLSFAGRFFEGNEENQPTTIGGMLLLALKWGTQPWLCGSRALDSFVEQTVEPYRLINDLFMNCIRATLISADRRDFARILSRCSDGKVPTEEVLKRIRYIHCMENKEDEICRIS